MPEFGNVVSFSLKEFSAKSNEKRVILLAFAQEFCMVFSHQTIVFSSGLHLGFEEGDTQPLLLVLYIVKSIFRSNFHHLVLSTFQYTLLPR